MCEICFLWIGSHFDFAVRWSEVCNQENFGAARIYSPPTRIYLPRVFRISQTLKLSRFQALHQLTEKKKNQHERQKTQFSYQWSN